MTLPDDLAEAVDNYLRAQEAPPALTTVVQAALRDASPAVTVSHNATMNRRFV